MSKIKCSFKSESLNFEHHCLNFDLFFAKKKKKKTAKQHTFHSIRFTLILELRFFSKWKTQIIITIHYAMFGVYWVLVYETMWYALEFRMFKIFIKTKQNQIAVNGHYQCSMFMVQGVELLQWNDA